MGRQSEHDHAQGERKCTPESDFESGRVCGYLNFLSTEPAPDAASMYDCLLTALRDSRYSKAWRAGYCVGMAEAYSEQGNRPEGLATLLPS
jgi:hypothetical protein